MIYTEKTKTERIFFFFGEKAERNVTTDGLYAKADDATLCLFQSLLQLEILLRANRYIFQGDRVEESASCMFL